jgi:anthranilate synthase/aminodeoxychorismate synthase-like glutamine amidotransferase
LGICLGHQLIGEFFGGKICRAKKAIHGKTTPIHHHGEFLFSSLPDKLTMVQYNSLVISQENFPKDLIVLAYNQENEIMAIRHKEYPLVGLQFHPESVGSEKGDVLLSNFLRIDQ